MADTWHDADADEHASLIRNLDGVDEPHPPPPSFRKRGYARAVLLLVLLPFVSLLWLASLTNPAPTPEHPPPADTFALDPAFDLAALPHMRVYRWTVSAVPVPGANRTRFAINGRSPGPLIEANVHDRILVYVTNGLETEGTHGLPQPGTPFYDGVPGITQCPIPPGATLLYNFTFGAWSGTTWWHGHTGMQHTDGLFGPLVVHAGATDEQKMEYDTDNSNPMETVPEPVPDAAAINGLGSGPHDSVTRADEYFEVRVTRGKTMRLRLIHAGTFAPLRFYIDGHALTVIEADGTPVTPVRVRDLVLQPAQRYSVLVTASMDCADGEAFWIRARIVDDQFAYTNYRMQSEARAVLRCTVTSSKNADTDPPPLPTTVPAPPADEPNWYALEAFDEWALRPADNVTFPSASGDRIADDNANLLKRDTVLRQDPTAAVTIPFKFSIQRTHQRNWRTFVNGTAWELMPLSEAALVADTAGIAAAGNATLEEGVQTWPNDQLIATVAHGQIVDFVITNLDDGGKAVHGHSPWLLGHGRGRFKAATMPLNTNNPMRRDTFNVPAHSWAVVRMLADNAGYWAWHMASGGLFQIAVPSAAGGRMVLPDDIVQQCDMWRHLEKLPPNT
ncbi:multi-copper oxidase [Mycena pura]|uniref:Multi-copper oxidase n=1 Tax=Mycena pura TaxID=153505 RepID=A0AAD6UUK0_9AGAR|nr:multi-copper oxidase [Mycena pura]